TAAIGRMKSPGSICLFRMVDRLRWRCTGPAAVKCLLPEARVVGVACKLMGTAFGRMGWRHGWGALFARVANPCHWKACTRSEPVLPQSLCYLRARATSEPGLLQSLCYFGASATSERGPSRRMVAEGVVLNGRRG